MSIDHAYAELGLPVGASESEVKAAWRRLVSHWHPDRNSSREAVDLMQRINRAYERIRLAALAEGVGDEASASPGGVPARTLQRRVRLSLEEAALGCLKVLRGRLTEVCEACAGSGALRPAAPCTRCAGAGKVRSSAWFGWLSSESACAACEGRGVLRRACGACEGRGRRSTAYRRTVRIPAGVRQGDVLSAPASGEPRDGFDGTIDMTVEISAHRLFKLGEDGILRCEMPVDGFAWMANAWVDVPTLTGLQQMRLQRGRHAYRLRGQGVPIGRREGPRGDFLVSVVPTFPDRLSAAQERLLEQLAATSTAGSDVGAAAVRAWQSTVQAWEGSRRPATGAP